MNQQHHDNDHQETPASKRTWVSCQTLSAMLGCHEQTLRKMATEGVIPALKVGSYYRFCVEDVEAALAVRRGR